MAGGRRGRGRAGGAETGEGAMVEAVPIRATTIAGMMMATATAVGANSLASTEPPESSGRPEKETCSDFTLPPIPKVPGFNERRGK
eukprot:7276834-Alexandrium_andersonii.AAC.1